MAEISDFFPKRLKLFEGKKIKFPEAIHRMAQIGRILPEYKF